MFFQAKSTFKKLLKAKIEILKAKSQLMFFQVKCTFKKNLKALTKVVSNTPYIGVPC
jgi:hypothetical protein